MGFFHQKGVEETYWVHLRDGKDGPRDRSGRTIDLFDQDNIAALTVPFKLQQDATDNLVGSILRRMNSPR